MGHKVNPNGFRLGITTSWTSNWYAERKVYSENLLKDIQVRAYLRKKLSQASVSRIQIDRPSKSARVTIHTARPGIVIGKKGEDIEKLKAEVAKRMGLKADSVHISVEEIRKPELDAQLVADSIAQQLERRIMFRRAMKRSVQNAMRLGAGGIKIQLGGRLNGAEIARTEWY
ncbi:MAG: 30S ribosomal protein S3, partial [Bradyrhizobium sp.]